MYAGYVKVGETTYKIDGKDYVLPAYKGTTPYEETKKCSCKCEKCGYSCRC